MKTTSTWKSTYVILLALTSGATFFGYDMGVMSVAILYMREEFPEIERKTWLQEIIVSMAVGGAIFGAALGGWMSEALGRKKSILAADLVFAVGTTIVAAAPSPFVIILGRGLVGLGIGVITMAAPMYISEASPTRIRGALVSTNGLLITGGRVLSYLINLGLTNVYGNWRWMLGIDGLTAVVQFVFMLTLLPESPRWLYTQDKVEEAKASLAKIYLPEFVDDEMQVLHDSVQIEREEDQGTRDGMIETVKAAFRDTVVRRGLYAGITVQIAQQFSGISSVIFYIPTILQFAGYVSTRTAMGLTLITSVLNFLFTGFSMWCVDKYGRRKLMLISMLGIIACLGVLSGLFYQAELHAPHISDVDSSHFGKNLTCPAYSSASNHRSWSCLKCVKAKCGFCANQAKFAAGACLASQHGIKSACNQEHRVWYSRGCPSKVGMFVVILFGMYIVMYAPGMGTIPWVVNAEIYPLKYRGFGGGLAAVTNWTTNVIVTQTFLTITDVVGFGGTFLLFGGFSVCALIGIYLLVPETGGVEFDEVRKVLQTGFKPSFTFARQRRKGSTNESA